MKHHHLTSTFALAASLVSLCLGTPARAGIITSDPSLPPFTGYYETPGIFAAYAGPGLTIVFSDTHLTPLIFGGRTPSGPDELENFTASLDGTAEVIGVGLFPVSSTGPTVTVARGKVGNVTGTFPTEMLALNMSGVTPLGPFMIRESPTLPSLGQTTITDIGGGLYQIDSFFDIFTELSIDGGATWFPDTSGPAHATLVPEPGATLLLVLGLGGMLLTRRRLSTASSQ